MAVTSAVDGGDGLHTTNHTGYNNYDLQSNAYADYTSGTDDSGEPQLGDLVVVLGRIGFYKGHLEIRVDSMRTCDAILSSVRSFDEKRYCC